MSVRRSVVTGLARVGFLTFLAFIFCLSPSLVNAQGQKAKKTRAKKANPSGGGKLDISDLEKKYWSPKDTDFGVVQNRTYSKEKRISAALQYGPIINDAFNSGNALSLGVNYYFNERTGVEFRYMNLDLENSEATDVFLSQLSSGTAPDFNRMQNFYGLSFNWVPFYSKMSILGRKIIYFDMAISPGIGMVQYEQLTQGGQFNDTKSSIAFTLDLTQHFFLSKNWSIRADFKNLWYSEEIVTFGGGSTIGGVVKDKNRKNSTSFFMIGAQYFF